MAQWRGNNNLLDSTYNNFNLEVPAGNNPRFNSVGSPEGSHYFNFRNAGTVLVKTNFVMPNTFSFCAWVNPDDAISDTMMRLQYGGTMAFSFQTQSHNVRVRARNGQKEYTFVQELQNPIFYFVCFTYNYNTDTPTLYVNGAISGIQQTSSFGGGSGSGGLYVGGESASNRMDGYMVCYFPKYVNKYYRM